MDAIERVEVAVRTSLVYHHAHAHGAFGYVEGHTLPNLRKNEFTMLQGKFREAVRQSKDRFVEHFQSQYGDQHPDLPLWMLVELMSFGMMFTFFRGVDNSIKRQIAGEYSLRFGVLQSWLHSLNALRNICAHHSRLWNRILGVKPLIPAKDAQWHQPVAIPNNQIFGILTLLRYLLKAIAPQSQWAQRLIDLLDRYPDIPIDQMGFPPDWKECAIWK